MILEIWYGLSSHSETGDVLGRRLGAVERLLGHRAAGRRVDDLLERRRMSLRRS